MAWESLIVSFFFINITKVNVLIILSWWIIFKEYVYVYYNFPIDDVMDYIIGFIPQLRGGCTRICTQSEGYMASSTSIWILLQSTDLKGVQLSMSTQSCPISFDTQLPEFKRDRCARL